MWVYGNMVYGEGVLQMYVVLERVRMGISQRTHLLKRVLLVGVQTARLRSVQTYGVFLRLRNTETMFRAIAIYSFVVKFRNNFHRPTSGLMRVHFLCF